MEWEEHGRCQNCKEVLALKDYSSPDLIPFCPMCGVKNEFEIVWARQIYIGKWYNPFSWGKYGWEVKSE